MIAAGKEELIKWFLYGVEHGHKYMFIVYDRMEFPEEADSAYYADSEDEAREGISEFNRDAMCKVMEVYDLTMDMEAQMAERRAWNLPKLEGEDEDDDEDEDEDEVDWEEDDDWEDDDDEDEA